MVHDDLPERLRQVQDRIAESCARAGRDPAGIRVVAITKGHPAEAVRAAIDAGLRDVGENRVDEAQGKFSLVAEPLARLEVARHMVGHLQRNKAGRAVGVFDWIQSVDSVRLARALSSRLEGSAGFPILVEVNVSGEAQKHGFAPDEAIDGVAEIAALPGLSVRGLMTMAPWTDEHAVLRSTFRRARELFDRLAAAPRFDTLSMGMSGDFPIAVEEGATMLRLGTALFGCR